MKHEPVGLLLKALHGVCREALTKPERGDVFADVLDDYADAHRGARWSHGHRQLPTTLPAGSVLKAGDCQELALRCHP